MTNIVISNSKVQIIEASPNGIWVETLYTTGKKKGLTKSVEFITYNRLQDSIKAIEELRTTI